jgi:hypothetical protein
VVWVKTNRTNNSGPGVRVYCRNRSTNICSRNTSRRIHLRHRYWYGLSSIVWSASVAQYEDLQTHGLYIATSVCLHFIIIIKFLHYTALSQTFQLTINTHRHRRDHLGRFPSRPITQTSRALPARRELLPRHPPSRALRPCGVHPPWVGYGTRCRTGRTGCIACGESGASGTEDSSEVECDGKLKLKPKCECGSIRVWQYGRRFRRGGTRFWG